MAIPGNAGTYPPSRATDVDICVGIAIQQGRPLANLPEVIQKREDRRRVCVDQDLPLDPRTRRQNDADHNYEQYNSAA
jgi:hypothetical protein